LAAQLAVTQQRVAELTPTAEEAASLRAREVVAHHDGDEAGEKVLALLQRARKDEEEATSIKNKQDELFQRDAEAASRSSTS
jgi:DNA primase